MLTTGIDYTRLAFRGRLDAGNYSQLKEKKDIQRACKEADKFVKKCLPEHDIVHLDFSNTEKTGDIFVRVDNEFFQNEKPLKLSDFIADPVESLKKLLGIGHNIKVIHRHSGGDVTIRKLIPGSEQAQRVLAALSELTGEKITDNDDTPMIVKILSKEDKKEEDKNGDLSGNGNVGRKEVFDRSIKPPPKPKA
jgi:hypothetical protein